MASTWTKDAAGNYVDWTKPPYRQGSIVTFVLEGEDPAKLSSEIRQKRIMEYYRVLRRDMRKR